MWQSINTTVGKTGGWRGTTSNSETQIDKKQALSCLWKLYLTGGQGRLEAAKGTESPIRYMVREGDSMYWKYTDRKRPALKGRVLCLPWDFNHTVVAGQKGELWTTTKCSYKPTFIQNPMSCKSAFPLLLFLLAPLNIHTKARSSPPQLSAPLAPIAGEGDRWGHLFSLSC